MVNIKKQTQELIKQLKEWGEFGGLSIEVDPESEEDWSEYYSIFIVDIIDFDVIGSRSEYMEFHEADFWDDLNCWVSSYFDERTTIKIWPETGEVKIYDEERMRDAS